MNHEAPSTPALCETCGQPARFVGGIANVSLCVEHWNAAFATPVSGPAQEETGLLCVNEQPYWCGHSAHPNSPCLVRFDGGPGRSSSCRCKENRQVSQHEEDVIILKRNTPKWEHTRIDRLATAATLAR